MKAKLLVLLTFLFLFMDVFAMSSKMGKNIDLKVSSRSGHGHRSVDFPLSTSAIIDGSLLFINFSSPVENVTTVITDTETGELIHSSSYTSIEEITIDLNALDAGKYTLEILLDTTTLFGDFCI